MKKLLILVICTLSFDVFAGHIGDVTIKTVRLWDQTLLIEMNEDINAPSCATNSRWVKMTLDETNASNRKLSVVLAAHAQKSKFNPDCKDTCWDSGWMGKVTICQTNVSIQ
jgi:hypothetical protein